MKDQNSLAYDESQQERWGRALDLFIESVLKPDSSLRLCAHNQKCYNELMAVRQDILDHLYYKRNTAN